jgi:tetratricopeptide (TPR) repeat protein
MRRLTAFALLLAVCLGTVRAQQASYDSLRTDAERLYAEGSYALARDLYERASKLELGVSEKRWVAFRLADTLWRSQAATSTPDSTRYDEAIKQLDVLVRDISRVEDRDRVWAEVNESIGDFYWTRRESRNWWQAWQYYEKSLDWWAGSSAVDMARARYLKIVWTLAEPPGMQPYERYGYYGNNIPLPVLENALRIATSKNDQARAHYLIAVTLMRTGELDGAIRAPDEFQAALAPGKSVDWYDDALFQFAQFMENYGPVVEMDDGQMRREQDYVTALALYRRLVTEFRKGETQYFDQAQSQIANITGTTVNVAVENVFLPGSEVAFHLAWRNTKRVDLALYRVDLPTDVRFPSDQSYGGEWISNVSFAGRAPIKTWSKQTEDRGDHKPANVIERMDGKLLPGAYILEAKAGARSQVDELAGARLRL